MKNLIIPVLFALFSALSFQKAAAQDTDENVYNFVSLEKPPTYVGGIKAFYSFLGNTIKYPIEAKKNKIQGNVHISFIVEKDGSVSNVKVERKLGFGTDEEAMRAVALAKNWKPGLLDGKPIRTKYNIPVKFQLP